MTVFVINHEIINFIGFLMVFILLMTKCDVDKQWDCFA
jgi:hypothetical protein